MDFWFTTSHGFTIHNEPGTSNFVEGEPPKFPLKQINYREKCLAEGFARIGYPNTGDLNNPGQGRLAPSGYSLETVETISNSHLTKNQLTMFANIKAGDYISIPSDRDEFQIHFGRVLTKSNEIIPPYITPRIKAYYYYYDISEGQFYECAHRVNVEWAKDDKGNFLIFTVPEIGGVWRQAFGQLFKAIEKLEKIARERNLWF